MCSNGLGGVCMPSSQSLGQSSEPTPDGSPERERSDIEVDGWVCGRLRPQNTMRREHRTTGCS